jgi:predicted RNase H-like HicB family nuclease
MMFKELEILAAQAGYRFAEAVKDGEKWHVILDDEDGELAFVGDTVQEAVEKATERLVRILNGVGH